MAGAEFVTGSIEVRRSSPIHRLLNFLGAFFLGIGPAAAPTRSTENWWEREPTDTPMTLGRQAEMFDEAGQVTIAAKPAPAVKPAASRAIVSVQSRSRTTARVVATTRVQAATRVMAAPQAAARRPTPPSAPRNRGTNRLAGRAGPEPAPSRSAATRRVRLLLRPVPAPAPSTPRPDRG